MSKPPKGLSLTNNLSIMTSRFHFLIPILFFLWFLTLFTFLLSSPLFSSLLFSALLFFFLFSFFLFLLFLLFPFSLSFKQALRYQKLYPNVFHLFRYSEIIVESPPWDFI